MKRMLCYLLSVFLLTGVIGLAPTPSPAEAAELPAYLIINQVYGRADKIEGAISHSFIELYNPTDTAVDLSSYSLQYAKTGNTWQKLDLSGTIPARSSYLIRCYSVDGGIGWARYFIDTYDMEWADCKINNDAFKVVLMSNQILLTEADPSGTSGLVDFVGAGTTDFGETECILGISKQKSIRRIDFTDTDNNAINFEVLDYRTTGISDSRLDEVKPRYSGDGVWGEDIVPEDIIPDDEKLVFSHPAGVYTSAFSLTLTTGYSQGVIRYTTDGSDPKSTSAQYTAPITIKNRTTEPNKLSNIINIMDGSWGWYWPPSTSVFKGNVIKAQVFTSSGEPLTDVITNSYFVNTSYGNLPIISLVTDEANLFDSSTGIYSADNYGKKGSEWERPVHFEMIEDGEAVISQNMGIRIHGGATRNMAQKSLRLYAKKGYDAANPIVNYDIFEGRAKTATGDINTTFKRLLLRTSSNDNDSTLIRDSMMQSLMHDTNVDTQAYRQTVVFINGEFWGIYNIRERHDDESVKVKYNIDDVNDIGILEFPYGCNNVPEDYDTTIAAMVEDYNAYMEMWNWFNNTNSLASSESYEKAQTFMDIDSFIDYYIADIYVNNTDWPGNNNQMWRFRTDYPASSDDAGSCQDGRWRFMLKDTDFGFGRFGEDSSVDSLNRLINTTWTNDFNPAWSTLFFRRLLTNSEFKEKFVNRFCDLINTNFTPSVVNAVVDEMQGNISGTMQQQVERWGTIGSVGIWNNNISELKSFANSRPDNMRKQLKSTFDLGNTAKVSLKTDKSKGYVSINNMDILTTTDGVTNPSSWTGTYFTGMKQTITATPLEGYKFYKFIVGNTEYRTDTINVTITGDTVIEAVFVEESFVIPEGIPVTSVTLSNTAKTINVSGSVTLTASIRPVNATVKTVTWASSNPTVATVSSTGKVTGKSAGSAVITAKTANNLTATCTITVRNNGWVKRNGKEYYYKSGVLQKNKWVNNTYRTNSSGIKIKSKFVKISGKLYYFQANGKLAKGTKWIKVKNKTYRIVKNVVQTNKLVTVGKKSYVVNKNGIKQTGKKFVTISKKTYFLSNKNGVVKKNSWILYKGKYYYANKKGVIYKNKEVKIKGKIYKFNKKGVCKNRFS